MLRRQVHAMREKLEAAAAEASRLQRLRLEQQAAHHQAAMLQVRPRASGSARI
jgi:hypothetical protein